MRLRGLATPDEHIPFHERRALDAVLQYAQRYHWDFYVSIGDLLDLNAISHFNRGKPRNIEGERLLEDFEYAGRLLDLRLEALRNKNPECSAALLEGNHEFRIERFLDEHPYLEGLISVPENLRLKERGIQWVRNYSDHEIYRVGALHFIHGAYHGVHHARKHALEFGVELVYGHTHSIDRHAVRLEGRAETVVAHSIGTLCEMRQHYRKGRPRPVRWEHGFAVCYVDTETGDVEVFPVRINNGRFWSPEGDVYEGRS